MKVTKTGSSMKVDMSFDEWAKMGSGQGWIKNASDSESEKASQRKAYSEKVQNILKVASSGDMFDVSELPHLILLNTGSDGANFSTALAEAISKNKNVAKPRLVKLDITEASRKDPGTLKKSIGSIVTASNTVWKVVSADVPSMDVVKAFADNSGPMHKSNTWVVIETQD